MATTIIPNPGPVDPNLDPKAALEYVHENLRIAQGDLDKAGDVDDANYYAGLVDAYTTVQHMLIGRRQIATVEEFMAIAGGTVKYPNEVAEEDLPVGWKFGEDGPSLVVIPTNDFAWVHLHQPSGGRWRESWREVINGARNEALYSEDTGGYPPPVKINPTSIVATTQDSVQANAIAWYCGHPVTELYDQDGWYGNIAPLAIRMPNGDLVLVEGNHRWIASLLRREVQMPVQIIDSPTDLREEA